MSHWFQQNCNNFESENPTVYDGILPACLSKIKLYNDMTLHLLRVNILVGDSSNIYSGNTKPFKNAWLMNVNKVPCCETHLESHNNEA